MTSLTPYQDAARAVFAKVDRDFGHLMAAPGKRGLRYRINYAVNKALLQARATELDAGFSHEQCDVASIVTVANVVCSLVTTDAAIDPRSPDALKFGLQFLEEVANNLRRRLGPQASDEHRGAYVAVAPGGTA